MSQNIELLEAISTFDFLNETPKTLFVTDKDGNILISNAFTALTLGMTLEELIKSNVYDLVKRKFYDVSLTIEAIKQKEVISRYLTTRMGFRILVTSTPLFNADGEVYLVVTSSDPKQQEDFVSDAVTNIEYHSNKKIPLYSETETEKDNDVIAESRIMSNILKACDQIAQTDCKVLLFGESGTGKEVLSNFIHNMSKRADKSFISVNCAAIPENLFESELFGYEKGAFTGAINMKKGLLEMANEGTLFLDEISEMPLGMQAKLLRVLETPEVRRIGGIESFKVNFRLIAATNKDLEKMVAQGKFRQDLYYRINVVPIHIPPLRKRKEDIVGLANKFLKEFNHSYGKNYKMDAKHFKYLISHDWPGNIRELKNYIERLVVVDDSFLETEEHTAHTADDNQLIDLDCIININSNWPSLKEFLREAEELYINHVLSECNGKKGVAAEKLGIYRTVLYRKLKDIEAKHNEIK